MSNSDLFRRIIRILNPLSLLGAAMFYALGAGVAHFLGKSISWDVYWGGQTWIALVQISAACLGEYFRPTVPENYSERMSTARLVPLLVASACLTVTASLTIVLIGGPAFDPTTGLVLLLIFLGWLFQDVPPIRLSATGYGELARAIVEALLLPALAFLLQSAELHRLLAMTTFPLVTLHLGMQIALQFPNYARDMNSDQRRLLIRLGWQPGMSLHNILVLSAFVLLGIAMALGMPFNLGGPAMLGLPLAALEVWQMRRIANGAVLNWDALNFTALALLGITTYLLVFTFWTQ